MPVSRYDATVLADSPTRYYKCGEFSGTSWVDNSGNAGHGTIAPVGGAINYRQANLMPGDPQGRSLRENGDGGYCIPDSINYSPVLTIEFWMTWADTWENEGAIPSSPTNGQAGIIRRDTTLGSLQYFNGGGYFNDINSTLIDVKNRPYHLVAEWGGGNFDLWINGVHQATIPSGHSFTSSNPPQFGSQSFGLQWCWDGLLQNIAIYNGVRLGADRIYAHYRAGIEGPPFPSFFQQTA